MVFWDFDSYYFNDYKQEAGDAFRDFSNDKILNSTFPKIIPDNFKSEILPTLNRRIIFPLFIPVIALIASLLITINKRSIFNHKISIFGYSFLVLLYAELTIRYTGLYKFFANIFILSPFILLILVYSFYIFKLKLFQKHI